MEAPAFVKPMENKEVLIGESSVLECMKSGSPSPTLRWYRVGAVESAFTQIEMTDRHFFTAEDQLLIIVKTTENDAGIYKCEMENKMGKISATMKLTVRTTLDGQVVNVDEMTCIVIITVVCCAVGTSIIWVVIIYQTRKESSCSNLMGSGGSGSGNNSNINNEPKFEKSNNAIAATTTSMLLISDVSGIKPEPQHPLRTATISNGRGVIRSTSISNNSRSSVGPYDDMFRKYPSSMGVGGGGITTTTDDDLSNRQTKRQHSLNMSNESDDDDNVHDGEALLGTAYFGLNGPCYRQPRKKSGSDINSSDSNVTSPSITKDSLLMRSRDCIDTATITTNTEDCELDEKCPISSISNGKLIKSNSLSTSSSCDSIPPLPYSASHELNNGMPCNNSLSSGSVSSATPPLTTFQVVDREHQQNLLNQQRMPLLTNNSPSRQIYRDKSSSPVSPSALNQPKVHVPIPPRKPNIQTNKLNELVATLNN